jgi:hypothetical protein
MITVVNKYKHQPTDHDVYIGRGSVFGNPYSHLDSKHGVIKTETREEAIELFEKFLKYTMATKDSNDLKVTELKQGMKELVELAEKQDVNLVCFCKPKTCHGDIIKEWIDNQLNKHDESK